MDSRTLVVVVVVLLRWRWRCRARGWRLKGPRSARDTRSLVDVRGERWVNV
jgi:hypothetical protein